MVGDWVMVSGSFLKAKMLEDNSSSMVLGSKQLSQGVNKLFTFP